MSYEGAAGGGELLKQTMSLKARAHGSAQGKTVKEVERGAGLFQQKNQRMEEHEVGFAE